jgi:hypothetical protein
LAAEYTAAVDGTGIEAEPPSMGQNSVDSTVAIASAAVALAITVTAIE